ncbi:MAG: methyltransferase domain-containing protein, partial [Acidimicrobiales bacterium]
LQQRRDARRGSGERLGYMRGGFRLLFRALEADLGAAGVVVRTGARVERILVEGGRATGVVVGEEGLEADAVLFAGTLPRLVGLVPHELVAPQWRDAVGLGCVCVIVDLPRALTPVFWTNVCDDDIPFGGIIEHTNLVPTSWYGGRHVVYLSRYFAPEEDIATADLETVTKEWLEACERLFPHFSAADVGDLKVFRTPYGAPLVSYPYLPRIAPVASHIPGVYVATTAQIYPQDRGMSEGIKRGVQAAELILATGWMCPVCHGRDRADLYGVPAEGSEGGVDAVSFRPSSDRYGQTAGRLVRCTTCGHASLLDPPAPQAVSEAYAEAADEVSLREEPGQVETARRALGRVERQVAPGRLLDVGCWTGSFLEAGRQRGWQARGVEPSTWAAARAAARGLDVEATTLDEADLAPESFDLVVACDVLEHLLDPAAALSRIGAVLRPGGILYLTVPDAGSRLARVMGRRWWSVLPMHVQYYTRASMTRLLDRAGFSVTEMATHPKVFSAGYYAERLASFVPGTAGIVTLAGRLRIAGRLVAPDFRDRLQAIATRR